MSLNHPGDSGQGLTSKLDAAQAALDRGDTTAGRNQIESAIRQLGNWAQSWKLGAAEADP